MPMLVGCTVVQYYKDTKINHQQKSPYMYFRINYTVIFRSSIFYCYVLIAISCLKV
jgi:hypothetical protein